MLVVLNIIFPFCLGLISLVEGSPNHVGVLNVHHSHVNLQGNDHWEDHLIRIRNMLFALFGTGLIIFCSVFLYKCWKSRVQQRTSSFETGIFSERGALLPIKEEFESSSPPIIQTFWPFNTLFFNRNEGVTFPSHNVMERSGPAILPAYYNPEDLNKDNYNPWERI